MTKYYATLDGLKRAAKKARRGTGIAYRAALEKVAREAGYADYHAAQSAFAESAGAAGHQVKIFEFWSDHSAGTRGNESRTFLFDKPLGELVTPAQLTGHLSGARIDKDGSLIGYGRSDSQRQARAEICRMARTLQFISATGLKPARGGKCYPKGDQNFRPPGADHDRGWYDPATRSFLLTEEPYPGRHQLSADARRVWHETHGWETARSHWGSMYGFGTELHLTVKPGKIDLAALIRRLAALPAPYSEVDWPGEAPAPALSPVEYVEMSPELAAALKHQRDIDIEAAGPKAPELSGGYRAVDVSSRWDVRHELVTMRAVVDALPDHTRERIASIWCDSNANADYWVRVVPGGWYAWIAEDVKRAVREVTNGFNGLLVEGDGHEERFDAEWEGDDYDYASETPGDLVEINEEDL